MGDVSWDTTTLIPHMPAADEKVVAETLVEGVGGVVTNAAVAAALAGADVALVCPVGNDVAGVQVRDGLARLGVAADLRPVEGLTCRALVVLDVIGEKRLVLVPGATMYPTPADVGTLDLDGVAWVHTAVYETDAAVYLARRCRDAGIPLSVDLEPVTMHYGLAPLGPILNGARVVYVNQQAAAVLGPDPVATLVAQGVHEVVLSLGASGAVWTDGRLRAVVPAPPSNRPVRDTTGAGDALAGWFATGRVDGMQPVPALARAVLAASTSCGALGAAPSYPRRDDLPPSSYPPCLLSAE